MNVFFKSLDKDCPSVSCAEQERNDSNDVIFIAKEITNEDNLKLTNDELKLIIQWNDITKELYPSFLKDSEKELALKIQKHLKQD